MIENLPSEFTEPFIGGVPLLANYFEQAKEMLASKQTFESDFAFIFFSNKYVFYKL